MSYILLIDDSADMLNVLHWSLQRKGYACDTAYYRDRIFDKISKLLPALIIMDIDLGSEDGRKICREIKENSRTKTVPVLLCSGRHDLLEDYSGCLADDFIQKPFEMHTMLNKIQKLVRN